METLYWHWLREDKRLQWGSREVVEAGETYRVEFPFTSEYDGREYAKPTLCKAGLHASERAIDALQYAPGPIVCRVSLGGVVVSGDDKVVASERAVLWMADATNTLHEFACRCAETAMKTAKVEDQRCWAAIETKRRWLKGEATDEELDAAWDAAWDAARDAAWDAARDAAWDAARDAARAAARDAARAAAWAAARDAARDAARAAARDAARAAAWAAARDAARDAAWDAARAAARDAQNQQLHDMLMALQPQEQL
jgi:hypothetical protein